MIKLTNESSEFRDGIDRLVFGEAANVELKRETDDGFTRGEVDHRSRQAHLRRPAAIGPGTRPFQSIRVDRAGVGGVFPWRNARRSGSVGPEEVSDAAVVYD